MDVYRQAAAIVEQVRQRQGTAKNLCLEKQVQKKKATYAVVCEALRYYPLLEDVLQRSQFFRFYPKVDFSLAIVLCYDALLGKGIKSRQDPACSAIQDSLSYLQSAYRQCSGNHKIEPRKTKEELDEAATESKAHLALFPRYARANPLKGMPEDEIFSRLQRRKREREGDAEGEGEGTQSTTETFGPVWDSDIPQLLKFAPGTDLHAHSMVKKGQLVLQDKGSCFPAAILLDAVTVLRYNSDGEEATTKFRAPKWVIDGCAAPGNKTSQLAALGAATGVKILAVERDEKRVELLSNRLELLGAKDAVMVCHGDFTDLDPSVHEKAEAILLDPSCTSSGVVTRIDIATQKERAPAESAKESGNEGADGDAKPERPDARRIRTLAALQKRLLTHALTAFPKCHRVVYSTCSINEEEDEEVVMAVLSHPEVEGIWGLSHIIPTWGTRGHLREESQFPLDRCIRCDPEKDATNGFFVACFDRFE
jgi:putative methyltransferase